MSGRRMVNPKLLLLILGIALVTFSAIAIFLAVSYTPSSTTPSSGTTSSTTTSSGTTSAR